MENTKNIYERKLTKEIPKTRDRFIGNAFSQLLAPDIARTAAKRRFDHDKLNVKDIHGANVDTYGKYKRIQGRNNMDFSDIEKSKPNVLKQNRITNIPDHKLNVQDIDSPQVTKFKSNPRDPLNPIYKVETQSRRHVIEMGKIEGSVPKITKSTVTRR